MDAARISVQSRLDASGSYQRWVLLTALAGMFATTFPVTLLAVSLGDDRRRLRHQRDLDRLGDLGTTAGVRPSRCRSSASWATSTATGACS